MKSVNLSLPDFRVKIVLRLFINGFFLVFFCWWWYWLVGFFVCVWFCFFPEMPCFHLVSKSNDMRFCPQEIFISAKLHFMKLEACQLFSKNNHSAFVFMSDYGIWVNFTRFNISWKAGGLKNAEPVKLVLFLKIWFRALANAHRSGSPAQDVTWVPWAASAPCGAGKARHDVVLRTWRCTLLSDTKTWIYTCHPLKGLALWLNGNIEKSRVTCKP